MTTSPRHLAAALPEAQSPGWRALRTLIVSEARMVMRDTAGLIVPLGLPLLILLTSAGSATSSEIYNGLSALELFVLPLVLTMVLATIGIINMPSFLAYYRRSGILRRFAATPVSPMLVLVAQAVVSVLQAALGIGAAVLVAHLAFGAQAPRAPLAMIMAGLLAVLAMYGLGMIVAAVAPTPNSAVAIGLVTFFAFGALGGMFGGRDALPGPLADIGGWLPVGAAVDAIAAAWAGIALPAASMISLGVTFVAAVVIAGLLFRWE